MFEKLRKWLLGKLLRENDGYTFTGFSEQQPIKFYYCESNDTYYMGMRSGTMYFARPTLTGWSLEMSKYLDWKSLNMTQPIEVEFHSWIHGILENIYYQYREEIKAKIVPETKTIEMVDYEGGPVPKELCTIGRDGIPDDFIGCGNCFESENSDCSECPIDKLFKSYTALTGQEVFNE